MSLVEPETTPSWPPTCAEPLRRPLCPSTTSQQSHILPSYPSIPLLRSLPTQAGQDERALPDRARRPEPQPGRLLSRAVQRRDPRSINHGARRRQAEAGRWRRSAPPSTPLNVPPRLTPPPPLTAFDPSPHIQTLESALAQLLPLRKANAAKTAELERSVAAAERAYRGDVRGAKAGFEVSSVVEGVG